MAKKTIKDLEEIQKQVEKLFNIELKIVHWSSYGYQFQYKQTNVPLFRFDKYLPISQLYDCCQMLIYSKESELYKK